MLARQRINLICVHSSASCCSAQVTTLRKEIADANAHLEDINTGCVAAEDQAVSLRKQVP